MVATVRDRGAHHVLLESFQRAPGAEVPFPDFDGRRKAEVWIIAPAPQRHAGNAKLAADLRVRHKSIGRFAEMVVITGVLAVVICVAAGLPALDHVTRRAGGANARPIALNALAA